MAARLAVLVTAASALKPLASPVVIGGNKPQEPMLKGAPTGPIVFPAGIVFHPCGSDSGASHHAAPAQACMV